MKGTLRFLRELFRLNLIDKRVKLGKNVRIGHFTIIEQDVEIGDNVWIGSWVHIRPGTRIGYDSHIRDQCFIGGNGIVIGNHTRIYQQCTIAQGMKIGNKCFIAPRVTMTNVKRITYQRVNKLEVDSPVIEDGARIGGGVVILPRVRIGVESMIGAGSVVTKNTEPFGVYYGNPAKLVSRVLKGERL